MKRKFLIPLLIFVPLLLLLGVGLKHDPREVPSPLIGKPAPAFDLAQLDDTSKRLSPEALKGKPWLLSVWASWCTSCQQEHPLLVDLAKRGEVTIVGLDYKDEPAEAKAWLQRWGNPYSLTVSDRDGRVGINYGVYGVPETYVIDRAGVIRYKHIGPLTPEVIDGKLLPMMRRM
jgi:cytochrome c biogenesis protein CcmG/thiol:disulfide interchange protein DsbE